MSGSPDFISIRWHDRVIQVEIQQLEWHLRQAPLVVFLHEGLGSIEMWGKFPAQLCRAGNLRGLVFSRPGYGRSSVREGDDHLAPDFMHRQALEVLPAVLAALHIDQPIWIFGHSDGGSIALIYAARKPEQVSGLIVLAPHIFVEEMALAGIEEARLAYQSGVLARKLERYHDDADSVFWGWNRIWLDPAFKSWDIRAELAHLHQPILAIQGVDDEYGTLRQIEDIAVAAPQTELLKISACGHSPHRDQPHKTIYATLNFIARHEMTRT